MYDAAADPYCYPGTAVLKNIPGIQDQTALGLFETISTAQRADEPLPHGRLSVSHYQAIHHHLFQDIYVWAGKFRTVRMAKEESVFCYPEHIRREMTRLFAGLKQKRFFQGLTADRFAAGAAHFLTTLNAIHPFREGNGRTQIIFVVLLADHAGHPLDLERLEPEPLLAAMVAGFRGKERSLVRQIRRLIA